MKLFLSLKKPLPSSVFVPIRRSKYRRGTPSAGTLYRRGVGKIRNFRPISLPILETVGPYIVIAEHQQKVVCTLSTMP